jgi:hypothetical protein
MKGIMASIVMQPNAAAWPPGGAQWKQSDSVNVAPAEGPSTHKNCPHEVQQQVWAKHRVMDRQFV